MSNEERRVRERQKHDLCTSQRFRPRAFCVCILAPTLIQPAPIYISQLCTKHHHTNLYAGTPTSGFKPLAEGVIFIMFLM